MHKKLMTGIAAISFGAVAVTALNVLAANDRLAFPEDYAEGVHYTTVTRGNVREEIFTSAEAIEAARAGRPLPDGTIIMMEDYRGSELYRYIVMEKRAGWGDAYPESVRTGDWEFREFRPDRTPNLSEDGSRCMSCHRPQAANDFVFTYDRMRAAR
ncbi:MAG: cytochrome P460 family protein [Shinella sp.]|nr:cytochrome P460 family protein [Shinella sp.]